MNKTWRIPSYSDVFCSGCRRDFLHCHLNKNNSNRQCLHTEPVLVTCNPYANDRRRRIEQSRAEQSRAGTWPRHSTLLCRHQPRRTAVYHEADRFWRYFPDDEDGDGPRNVGLLAAQPSDADVEQRTFCRTSSWKLSITYIKIGCGGSFCVLF